MGEDHARPQWTTSRRGQDSPWKSQSEWQRTEINGESTSMVWPALRPRTAKEQNKEQTLWLRLGLGTEADVPRERGGRMSCIRDGARVHRW